MQFERDDQGNYIGYHWEGGETFELAGANKLSLENLDNDRLLFVANTTDSDWGDKHSRLLKVVFQAKPYPLFTDFRDNSPNSFNGLTTFNDGDGVTTFARHRVRTDGSLPDLIQDGYNLFMLDDPKEELPEAFITEPKRWVISIEEV